MNARGDPFNDPLSSIKRFPAIPNKHWSSTSMKLLSISIGLISLQAVFDSNVDNCVTCGATKSATSAFLSKFSK